MFSDDRCFDASTDFIQHTCNACGKQFSMALASRTADSDVLPAATTAMAVLPTPDSAEAAVLCGHMLAATDASVG